MTAIDLDAIRARAEKATRVIPGQWVTSGNEVGEWTGEPDVLEGPMVTVHFDGVPGRDVADFIAHAREDVPALLAEIDRLLALVPEPPTDDEREALIIAMRGDSLTIASIETIADRALSAGFRRPRPLDREQIANAVSNTLAPLLGQSPGGPEGIDFLVADAVIALIEGRAS